MSRHAAMIADDMRSFRNPVRRAIIDAGMEADHMALTLEETVTALWDAREHLEWRDGAWLPLPPQSGA